MSGNRNFDSQSSSPNHVDAHLHSLFLNNGASQGFIYMVDSQEPSQYNSYEHRHVEETLGVNTVVSPNINPHPAIYATQDHEIHSDPASNGGTVQQAVPQSIPGSNTLVNTVRVSSLLQKASGENVVTSEAAGKRSAEFRSRAEDSSKRAPASDLVTLPLGFQDTSKYALYGASSSGNGGTYRSIAQTITSGTDMHNTPAAPSVPPHAPLASNTCTPVPGRVSSLLQKASGGSVVISEQAQARSAQFMARQPQDGSMAGVAPASGDSPIPPPSRTLDLPLVHPLENSGYRHPNENTNARAPRTMSALKPTAPLQLAGGRVSSLLQKASGGNVVISDAASAKSAQFMSAAATSAATPPLPHALSSATSGRVSSLLQKASGGAVVISDAARARTAQFIQGKSITRVGTDTSTDLGDSSDIVSDSAPTPVAGARTTRGGDTSTFNPHKESMFFGADTGGGVTINAPAGRVSSLLQKASGGNVVISDAASARSAQFMSAAATSAATPPPPQAGSSSATSGRVSSLLQKASGQSVLITDAARAKSAQFMAVGLTASTGSAQASVPQSIAVGGRVSSLLQKASGGAVVISETARARTAQFMRDGLETLANADTAVTTSLADADVSVLSVAQDPQCPPPGRVSSLLQKASGRQVVISDAARARSAQFMAQSTTPEVAPGPANNANPAGKISSLLQKASGGAVIISTEARARSAQFLAEGSGDSGFNAGPHASESFESLPRSRNLALLRGAADSGSGSGSGSGDGGEEQSRASVAPRFPSLLLQSASGKAVSISDHARTRAAQFLQQSEGTGLTDSPSVTAHVPSIAEQEQGAGAPPLQLGRVSSLLQKASGKSVVISDEAAVRSAQFMAQYETHVHLHSSGLQGAVSAPESAPVPAPALDIAPPGRVSSLLQKASGKSVVISDAARARSALLLASGAGSTAIGNGALNPAETVAAVPPSAPTAGRVSSLLQKASGKAVVISDEAGTGSARILDPVERDGGAAVATGRDGLPAAKDAQAPSLLQRASGRGVVISNEARAKSALFMQRGAASAQPPSSPSDVSSFQTVKNTAYDQEEDGSTTLAVESKRSHAPMLLEKASGKAVAISDEARAKSVQLMARLAQDSITGGASTRQPVPVTPAPHVMPSASKPHGFSLPLPVFSTFTPRPSTAANLPPRFIAERMASSVSTGSASVSSLDVSTSSALARMRDGPFSGVPTSDNGETKRKSVTFRDDVISGGNFRTACPDSFTPEASRIQRTGFLNPVDSVDFGPLSSCGKPFNPARVLFNSTDDGDAADAREEREGEEEEVEESQEPLFIATPRIDRAGLLLFDPLRLDSPPTSTVTSTLTSTGTPQAPRPLSRALFSPQGDNPPWSVAAADEQRNDSPADLGPWQDSVCDFSSTVLSKEVREKERMKLLCGVDSQNAVSVLHFDSTGALMLPSQGSALHSATFPPLLTRFYEQVLSCSGRGATTPAAVAESRTWLHMQYRWILWTLAAQERRHPDQYLGKLLTEEAVFGALQGRWSVYNSAVAPSALSAPSAPTASPSVASGSAGGGDCSTPATSSVGPANKRRRTTMYSTVTPSARKANPPDTLADTPSASAAERPPCDTDGSAPGLAVDTSARIPGAPDGPGGALRTAAAHFRRRGSMSPLQRCADIACLVWPLVVCFAGSKGGGNANSASKGALQVTDGWWWTCVQIDADLLKLYEKGLLKDGCKIIIFNGSFDIRSDAGTGREETRLQLTCNGTRLAAATARLGFAQPSALTRGISLKSITSGGGAVYAIRAKVLKICAPMCKVTQNASTDAAAPEGGPGRAVVLSGSEASELHRLRDAQRAKISDSIDRADELQLQALLEDIDCDEDLAKTLLAIERGSDVHVDDRTMRELMQTKERVQAYSQIVSQKLLAERTAHLQVSAMHYQDVLLQCALSGSLQWLRFQQRRGSAVRGEQTLMGAEFSLGATVLVTNLKPGRAPPNAGALGVLLASDSSTVRSLDAGPMVTPSKDCPLGTMYSPLRVCAASSPARASIQVLQPSGVLLQVPSLRSFSVMRSPQDCLLSGQEVTFAMLLLDWHVLESPEHSSVVELKVFGVDRERMGVLLSYLLPADLLAKLPWLAAGQVVNVDCAQLDHFDVLHDIAQVRRGERTVVSAVLSKAQQEAQVARSSTRTSFSAAKARPAGGGYAVSGVKRKAFAPPVVTPGTVVDAKRSRVLSAHLSAQELIPTSLDTSSVGVVCATPSRPVGANSSDDAAVAEVSGAESEFLLFEALSWLGEDEKRRFSALRQCARTYTPSTGTHCEESCGREVIARATVKVDGREGGGELGDVTNLLIFDELSFMDREAVVDPALFAALKASCGFCGAHLQQVSELCVVLARCTFSVSTILDAETSTTKAECWKVLWMAPAPVLGV